MLSIAISQERLEAVLAAGELACPHCSGQLSPWGFARSREVRMLDAARSVRPRRAWCQGCGVTHLLCPSWSVRRRRDGAEVIGAALQANARGHGHRTIAARLDRAPGTVRGWLRAFARRTESLYCSGVRWTVALGEDLGRGGSAGSPAADAVEALASAARAFVLRFGCGVPPWELIVALTGGLLHGRPRDPPGYRAPSAPVVRDPFPHDLADDQLRQLLRVKRRGHARVLTTAVIGA